jgi:hypothetical protein
MTTTEAVELHPVEVDLLCELAEVRAPFPLTVPSVGTSLPERRALLAVARQQLTRRGLAGNRGPSGPAATLVRMLRTCTGAIDLVVTCDRQDVGAVVLVGGLRALLLRQSPDGPDRPVRLAELSVDEAVRELCALVPPVTAGGIPAFTLPLAPVRQVFDRVRGGVQPLSDNDLAGGLGQAGLDERTAARLVTSLRQVSGSGQAGIARWQRVGARWQRSGEAVHWVDTGNGRFRLSQSADGRWASINPFSASDVRAAMRELGARARNTSDEESRP